jgi:hypothetical protein
VRQLEAALSREREARARAEAELAATKAVLEQTLAQARPAAEEHRNQLAGQLEDVRQLRARAAREIDAARAGPRASVDRPASTAALASPGSAGPPDGAAGAGAGARAAAAPGGTGDRATTYAARLAGAVVAAAYPSRTAGSAAQRDNLRRLVIGAVERERAVCNAAAEAVRAAVDTRGGAATFRNFDGPERENICWLSAFLRTLQFLVPVRLLAAVAAGGAEGGAGTAFTERVGLGSAVDLGQLYGLVIQCDMACHADQHEGSEAARSLFRRPLDAAVFAAQAQRSMSPGRLSERMMRNGAMPGRDSLCVVTDALNVFLRRPPSVRPDVSEAWPIGARAFPGVVVDTGAVPGGWTRSRGAAALGFFWELTSSRPARASGGSVVSLPDDELGLDEIDACCQARQSLALLITGRNRGWSDPASAGDAAAEATRRRLELRVNTDDDGLDGRQRLDGPGRQRAASERNGGEAATGAGGGRWDACETDRIAALVHSSHSTTINLPPLDSRAPLINARRVAPQHLFARESSADVGGGKLLYGSILLEAAPVLVFDAMPSSMAEFPAAHVTFEVVADADRRMWDRLASARTRDEAASKLSPIEASRWEQMDGSGPRYETVSVSYTLASVTLHTAGPLSPGSNAGRDPGGHYRMLQRIGPDSENAVNFVLFDDVKHTAKEMGRPVVYSAIDRVVDVRQVRLAYYVRDEEIPAAWREQCPSERHKRRRV